MRADFDLGKVIIRPPHREDKDEIVHIDSPATGFPRNLYFYRRFKRLFETDSRSILALVAEYDAAA